MSVVRRGLVAAAILPVALVMAALVTAACSFGGARSSEDAPPVPTARAERGDFRVVVEEVGVLKAERGERLVAQTWGQIGTLVDDGTVVKPGDVVVQLDVTELQSQLGQLDADLSESRSNASKQIERLALQQKSEAFDLAVSKANADFAQRKLESAQKALADADRQLAKGLISQQSRDEKEEAVHVAELEAERATVEHARKTEESSASQRGIEVERQQAESQFRQFEERRKELTQEIDEGTLKSPGAGRVFYTKRRFRGGAEERKPRVGDEVAPWYGSIAEIPDLASIIVRSQIDESLVGRVPADTPVEIEVGAVEGLKLSGKVERIDVLAVPRSRSEGGGFRDDEATPDSVEQVVFPTTIRVDAADDRLQPGMTVTVRYILQTVPAAISVPESAVFGSGTEAFVFVKSRKPERRPVTLGPSSSGRVVIASGLKDGDEVYLGDPRGAA
jgi:HlyD family secretion protein